MVDQEAILSLLEKNARLSVDELAIMTGCSKAEIAQVIADGEANKVILGYSAAINWEKTERDAVTALIEVRVTPQRDQGFDHIARRIYRHPEVQSCYLMSGGFDLMVIVEDSSLKAVARFVSEKIAPLDSVVSTRTHFILKKYKMNHLSFMDHDEDMREAVVL